MNVIYVVFVIVIALIIILSVLTSMSSSRPSKRLVSSTVSSSLSLTNFDNLTDEEMSALVMQDVEEIPHLLTAVIYDQTSSMPVQFDSREKWRGLITDVKKQGSCGSCWAFAVSSVLNDRFNISMGMRLPDDLSPEFMVACRTDLEDGENKCKGNSSGVAWKFVETIGTTLWSCYPYKSGDGRVGQCTRPYCSTGVRLLKSYKIIPGSQRRLVDEKSIQNEIMTKGPVRASMTVYKDFYTYKSGVYKHQSNEITGHHAIRIIGWGSDPSAGPYWICANSWGSSWGKLGGYFWIARGTNECGIEESINCADPLIE